MDNLIAQTGIILVLQSVEKGWRILTQHPWMEDFDPASVADALAVEEETDVPKRKRAKWSKEYM